jgi:hypothetical protein
MNGKPCLSSKETIYTKAGNWTDVSFQVLAVESNVRT